MRIEIEKQTDAETKEVWSFYMFDLSAVFIAWRREVKPKGKRKWTVEKFWDKYRIHDSTATEPVLPEIIRSEVMSEVIKHIRVYTWNEYRLAQQATNLQLNTKDYGKHKS